VLASSARAAARRRTLRVEEFMLLIRIWNAGPV
jgi:hypothetical protein